MDHSSPCAFPRGDVHNYIAPTFGDSVAPNPTPNFQANEKSFAESTMLGEAVYWDAAHSEGVYRRGHKNGTGKASTESNRPQKIKTSAPDVDAKGGISSRKSRKQLPSPHVDEPGNNTYEHSFNAGNSTKKSLVEIPDDEIDPQSLVIRDLIRLGEYKERLEIKEAAKLKTPGSNRRVLSCSGVILVWSHYFFLVEIVITLSTRWKKVKNLLRIKEAFHRQPKDNSKYDLVINELQNVVREKQESNADESSDMAGEEEEEPTHDNNGEVTKPEWDRNEEMETNVAAEVEAVVAEVHGPMTSDQTDDGGDFGGWNDEF